MSKKTVKAISEAFAGLSATGRLKAEIDLLTKCSSDTVYRLRYDTMQYDYISPSVKQLLGYSVAELKRINLRSLIVETRIVSDGMRAVESYTKLEETRKRGEVKKWQADYLMKAKDGRQVWVADVSYPWFDNKGAIIGSLGSLHDITERIQAEQKLREELMLIAHADPLTGLANRQMFWGKLEDEVKRIRRTHSDLSLLLIDIDRFEKITRTQGQAIGNSVVAAVASLIKGSLRDIDMAARLSEETFGVILPETAAEGALKVATRIRDSVVRHTIFSGVQKKPVGCTISAGVASTRFGQNTDAAHLYKLADMRLYIAKHTGEGQVSSDEMARSLH